MLINRSHRLWIIGTIVVFLVSTGLYLWYSWTSPNGPSGGSWQGMAFGVAGTLCMIFAGLLSGRKQLPGWRIGTVKWWLKGHLWVGLLSLPLILFHSGFRLGGPLEMALMIIFFIVIASGVIGLILQQMLPRVMSETVPAQAIYEQIPVACTRLRESADAVVSKACAAHLAGPGTDEAIPGMDAMSMTMSMTMTMSMESLSAMLYSPDAELWAFFQNEVDPFLSPNADRRHPLANSTYAAARISQYQGSLPPRFAPALAEIRAAVDERRQLMRQQRIHEWLHSWLLLHLPLSLALLVLGIVHIVMSIYY